MNDKAFDESKPEDIRSLAIGSLDFKAMYPSFEPNATAAIVRNRVEESSVKIEMDVLELARKLCVALEEDYIKNENIQELLHTTKEGQTKLKMTAQEITESKDFRTSKLRLNPPKAFYLAGWSNSS